LNVRKPDSQKNANKHGTAYPSPRTFMALPVTKEILSCRKEEASQLILLLVDELLAGVDRACIQVLRVDIDTTMATRK
jgi:hypothetical protein